MMVVVVLVVVVDKSDEPDPCYCKNGSLPFLSLLPLPPSPSYCDKAVSRALRWELKMWFVISSNQVKLNIHSYSN